MIKTRKVNLKGKMPPCRRIAFLTAEVPEKKDIPFALIHYSIGDQKQQDRLRLDIDKRVFLDHFEEDQEIEEVLRHAALRIVEILGAELYPWKD